MGTRVARHGRILLVIALIGWVASCADPADDPGVSAGARDLSDTSFVSTAVEGHELVSDTTIGLSFTGDTMAVRAGCNTMTGAYAVEDGTLAWSSAPAVKEMACDAALEDQDRWLHTLFTDGFEVSLTGSTLALTRDAVTIRFDQVQPADLANVIGRTWTLTTIIDGDTASSLPPRIEPRLQVGDDGAASLFAGCNSGSVVVEVDRDRLTFTPVSLSRKACPADAMAVEQAVVGVLDGPADVVTWDGTTLTITRGDRGLAFAVS